KCCERKYALRIDHLAHRLDLRQTSPEQPVIGAKIERKREGPQHQLYALGDLECYMGKQELSRFDFMREPGTPLAQELAVEQEGFVAHGVRLLRPSTTAASRPIMGSIVGVELCAEARPSASGATTWRRPV